jgi:SAM-dependent methyltransferase
MRKSAVPVYDDLSEQYDLWFERHPHVYESEIRALRCAIPEKGNGIEIGAGTGRFCTPFHIRHGVEPSTTMAQIAESRGVRIIHGLAEQLPVENKSYDYALMVTLDCFLSDVRKALLEAKRIIRDGGCLILGMIDRESHLGKQYESKKKDNPFYRDAHFHGVDEMTSLLQSAGFGKFEYWQTLTGNDESVPEDPLPGYGKGGFVVIRASKQ